MSPASGRKHTEKRHTHRKIYNIMSESGRLQSIHPPTPILACFRVIIAILPFAQLAVGAIYQFDCPRQRFIPVYLLGMGVVSLLLNVLAGLPCCGNFGNHSKAWSCFVALFFFCWFIAGNVWIYSIYEPNYNKTASHTDTYCNKTLYLFAFWSTNLFYILLALIIFSTCCRMCLCSDD